MRIGLLLFIIIVVLVGTAVFSPSARAELVTIAIEGVVNQVDDPYGVWGSIIVGDVITGVYTYDLETPDANPLAQYASYWSNEPSVGIAVSVGGMEFRSDPENVDYRVGISDGYESQDMYSIRSRNNVPVLDGAFSVGIYWQLMDSTETALSTTSLLSGPPDLDDWSFNDLHLSAGRARGLHAEITDVRLVPEPATICLLGIGALALRNRERRRIVRTECGNQFESV